MITCPDLVCPAHTEEYSPSREDLEQFLAWAVRLRSVMTGLIDQPDPNFGVDYRWCHFYPYRSVLTPGSASVNLEVRIRNHLWKAARVDVRLKFPESLVCDRPSANFRVGEKQQVIASFILKPKAGIKPGRVVVTADVTINGHRVGEYAEALVHVE